MQYYPRHIVIATVEAENIDPGNYFCEIKYKNNFFQYPCKQFTNLWKYDSTGLKSSTMDKGEGQKPQSLMFRSHDQDM